MKQVLSFLLSLVLMVGISTSAFAAGNTYNDVPTSHWAYQYIESVTEISRVSPKRGFLAVSAEVSSLRKRPSPARK